MSRTRPLALRSHGSLRCLSAITLSAAVLAAFSPCLARDWEISFVGEPTVFNSTGTRSLCFDSAGVAHVVYWGNSSDWSGRNGLYHACHSTHGWQMEIVSEDSGRKYGAALALDSSGRPHISYVVDAGSAYANAVMYAWRADSGWGTEVADSGQDIRLHSCIAIGSDESPHIAYYQGSGVYHAWRDSDGWHKEIADARRVSSLGLDLALDSGNAPYICYGSDYQLVCAHWTGSSWLTEVIDSVYSGWQPSIAMGNDDTPHLVYQGKPPNGSNKWPMHAFRDGSGWVIETVDTLRMYASGSISCGVDATGQVHVAYNTVDVYDLRYAVRDEYAWHGETIPAQSYAKTVSLALDDSGFPGIAYVHSATYYNAPNSIRLVRHDQSWAVEEIDRESCAGLYTEIVAADSDLPQIAYYDSWDGDLMYARWDSESWVVASVDTLGDAGVGASLAIDMTGSPSLSYYSGTQVKYAHNDGEQWTMEVVDSAGVPSYSQCRTSIVVDARLRPHVAYCATRGYQNSVVYAVREERGWTTTEVGEGWCPSMALDSGLGPHLAYQDGHWPSHLLYACREGLVWRIDTVDSSMAYRSTPSIALDASGRPHISYCLFDDYSGGPSGLWYAHDDGLGWHTEPVDPWPNVGQHSSIVIDQEGQPLICYSQQGGGRDLRFAWKDGETWHIGIIDDSFDVGEYCSLALDDQGHRHVSYHDPRSRSLKYAFSTGEGLWVHGDPPNAADLTLRIEGPCPTAGVTPFRLFLAKPSPVNVSVFDLGGRRVRIVAASPLPEGAHRLVWDGLDDRGLRVPSGTYICSAEAGGARASTRVVLIR